MLSRRLQSSLLKWRMRGAIVKPEKPPYAPAQPLPILPPAFGQLRAPEPWPAVGVPDLLERALPLPPPGCLRLRTGSRTRTDNVPSAAGRSTRKPKIGTITHLDDEQTADIEKADKKYSKTPPATSSAIRARARTTGVIDKGEAAGGGWPSAYP
jgi:hypothetical protein